jgi:hypothetical protein
MAKKPAKKEPAKTTAKRPTTVAVPLKNDIEPKKYASFRLQTRIKPGAKPKTAGAFTLLGRSLSLMAHHWKLFGGILLAYGVLNFVVLQGLRAASGDLSGLKAALEGDVNRLTEGLTLFTYLIGTSGASVSPTAGAYQFMLATIVSLALIWSLRQVYAGVKVSIRDGFYKGVYPLVPFLLVLVVIGLQLLPLGVGVMLFNAVMTYGIAATVVEQILWSLVSLSLATLSLYLICSSIFALYIVCLPDMTPMRALRSARELVRHRRFTVIRRLLFLPLALFLIMGLLVMPFILFATSLAVPVFFVLGMLLPAAVHSYLYGMYRSLL